MHPTLPLNSFAFVLATWLGLVATSASGQTSITNSNAPAPGISESTNPASKIQDVRAVAQKAEHIRTTCVNGRHRICGQVVQVTPGGLVVESGYTDLLRPELSNSWVAPSTVFASRPPNLIEEKVPGSACVGLVFLADIPKRPAVKLYDYVIIEAYPAGEYVYEPVPNVIKTIRRFSARLESAVQSYLLAEEK
jgi:hypothetical protein